MYLFPTSIGIVRNPAIFLKYSKLQHLRAGQSSITSNSFTGTFVFKLSAINSDTESLTFVVRGNFNGGPRWGEWGWCACSGLRGCREHISRLREDAILGRGESARGAPINRPMSAVLREPSTKRVRQFFESPFWFLREVLLTNWRRERLIETKELQE